MNKVILNGKILDISKTDKSFRYDIGIPGHNDILSFYYSQNRYELKGKYVMAEGYLKEHRGNLNVMATFVREVKLRYVSDFDIIE